MEVAVVAGAVVLVVILVLGARMVRAGRAPARTPKPVDAARVPAPAAQPWRPPTAPVPSRAARRAPLSETPVRKPSAESAPLSRPAANPPPAARATRAERPTVLVVDDSPVMRRTLMTLFAKAGYHTAGAEGGAAAVTWIRGNGVPGLVTLDMEMPDMDGMQTLAALRALGATGDVRAVFVSSKMHSARARETAAQNGAIGFFSKPYDPADLLALAHRVAPLA